MTHEGSVVLRASIFVSALAALFPAMAMLRLPHDPLHHVPWWHLQQHSAVVIIGVSALVGVALYYLLARSGVWRLWAFILVGLVTAELPALFYLVATPAADLPYVPLSEMAARALVSGSICAWLLYKLLKSHQPGQVE